MQEEAQKREYELAERTQGINDNIVNILYPDYHNGCFLYERRKQYGIGKKRPKGCYTGARAFFWCEQWRKVRFEGDFSIP
jgi:hypothetical protein